MLVNRLVGFDADNRAVCAGNAVHVDGRVVRRQVIALPSENIDFVDLDVRGKTAAQIEHEANNLTSLDI